MARSAAVIDLESLTASFSHTYSTLIDGRRLCELVMTKELGVTLRPVVDTHWFDQFA